MPDRPYCYRHRVPRKDRRVMLALLSGASNLSGYPLSRAAMVGSGSVYVILARLERRLGGVAGEWGEFTPNGGRRRYYRLTPEGRTRVMELLGLKDGDRADA